MSFVADACALIAFHAAAGATMSERGIAAMRSGEVLVSPITVWEITRKSAIGKLPPLPTEPRGGFAGFLRVRGYRLVSLGWEQAEQANALPPHHADPMDRMLIATALERKLPVITSDRIFARYGVQVLW